MKNRTILQSLMYLYGWIFVRPRRWFFQKMVINYELRWLPEKKVYSRGWYLPNLHWWILYKAIFKFCKWLYWDGWRPFCKWKNGWRTSFPLTARIIQWVGRTTAGERCGGGECYHCGCQAGCTCELSQDQTGKYCIITGSSVDSTPNGTDYRTWGVTICPKCGFQDHFNEGSL